MVTRAVEGIGAADSNELAQLIKLRVFFESIMSLDVAADPTKRQSALLRLRRVQEKMYGLRRAKPFQHKLFEEFWATDGEFHRELCLSSGQSHLAVAVDTVIRICKRFGRPKSQEDLDETLEEHEAIIDAIASEHGEDSTLEAIVGSIERHVENALQRWFTRERTPMARSEDLIADEPPEGIREAEMAFDRDLQGLIRDHFGKWVAYNRGTQLLIGESQTEVYRKCLELRLKHKVRIKKNELVVRSIGVINADAEV